MTTTANKGEIFMVNDSCRAFFHANVKRDVYMQFAEEDKKPDERVMCGKLNYSMYGTRGTRGAARDWFEECSDQLRSIGFRQGNASLRVFRRFERRVRTMVHGDDYVRTGMGKDVEWTKQCVEQRYLVKMQLSEPNKEHTHQIEVLNRVTTWDSNNGLIYEADPRHVEIIVQQFDLEQSTIVITPGTKEKVEQNQRWRNNCGFGKFQRTERWSLNAIT